MNESIKKLVHLRERLSNEIQEDYPVTSRVHPLLTFQNCFVKRDDELGFSISGTKFRKYRMLIPYLRQFNEVVVTGGAFSNHVLGITQLLIQNKIQFRLCLKGSPPEVIHGNYFFLLMLVPSSIITWTKEEFVVKNRSNVCVLPEGGALFSSFLGGLSLPIDILRNEETAGLAFEHIFIEAGTGVSAAALLVGLAYLEKKTHCHVLLMAEGEDKFLEQLKNYHASFEDWLSEPCPFPRYFTSARPASAASFGSTNAALFNFIVQTAQIEGLFLDPIYSGKLFFYAKEAIKLLKGNSLIVHSGGALTLTGFQSQIERN